MTIGGRLRAMGFALGTLLLTACSAGDQQPTSAKLPTPEPPSSIFADAGQDQSVFVNSVVKLNGVNSISTESSALTYHWSLRTPAGSKAALSDATLVNPTMAVDIAGLYEATLIVSDGKNSSRPDTVFVVVGTTNVQPAAAITRHRHALFNTPLTLDGSPSNDANKDGLSFQWEIFQPDRTPIPQSAIKLANTAAPIFTPDVLGLYTVRLTVNDGALDSIPAEITISVENRPQPQANAGPPKQQVSINTIVSLNGSGSTIVLNEDGTTTPTTNGLTYLWDILPQAPSPTPISTTNLDKPAASFQIPSNKSGVYVARLTVTEPNHPDPTRKSTVATTLITIGPEAKASSNVDKADPGIAFKFIGSSSVGTMPASYKWTYSYTAASGPGLPANFSNVPLGETADVDVNNPQAGTYTATLTFTDALGNQDTDNATVIVSNGPKIKGIAIPSTFTSPYQQSQIANTITLPTGNSWAFQSSQFLKPNNSTQFTATLSSVIGTPTCVWSSIPATLTFSNQTCTRTSSEVTITAPSSGTYNIDLKITDSQFTDGTGNPTPTSQSFSIKVAAPPMITFGQPPSSPEVCGAATVNVMVQPGSGNLDANAFQWSITTPAQKRGGRSYSTTVMDPQLIVKDLVFDPVQNKNIEDFVLFDNPAYRQVTQSPTNPASFSLSFLPDLPAPFTITLTVPDPSGVSSKESIGFIVPSLDANGDKSTALRNARGTSTNASQLGACASCHTLSMWGDGGTTTGPDHSAKGLQVFHKFNADGSVASNHSGNPLPSNVSRKDFCKLFQDFTQP